MTKKPNTIERVLTRECDVAMARKKRIPSVPAAMQNMSCMYRNNKHG